MEQLSWKNNLRELRKARGLTQRQVAKFLGLQCESRLSQWENGTSAPSIFNLLLLCRIYRVSCEEAFQPQPLEGAPAVDDNPVVESRRILRWQRCLKSANNFH